jgi:hypothetical protein
MNTVLIYRLKAFLTIDECLIVGSISLSFLRLSIVGKNSHVIQYYLKIILLSFNQNQFSATTIDMIRFSQSIFGKNLDAIVIFPFFTFNFRMI